MYLIFTPAVRDLLPEDSSAKFATRWLLVWTRLERVESAAVKDSAAIFLAELVRLNRVAPQFQPAVIPLVLTFGVGWPEISVANTGHISIKTSPDAVAELITWQTPST